MFQIVAHILREPGSDHGYQTSLEGEGVLEEMGPQYIPLDTGGHLEEDDRSAREASAYGRVHPGYVRRERRR